MTINVLEVIRQGQVGGGESHLLDLIAGFDERVNPIVLAFTGGQMIDELTRRGVRCYVINTAHPFDIRITKQIKKLILDENIQLIHAHGSRAASNVAFIARKLHIPMVYTVHGWSFHQDQSFLIKSLRAWSEKIICKLSRKVICVSESNWITGQETFGLKNALVIENGINLKRFNPDGNRKDLRKEFGFTEDDFVIGFVSRITLQKAPLDFVKRIAIAHQKDMKIVYTPIHGTGMMLIPRALKMWGFENVHTVPEQMIKDGNFPTVVSPNPENAEALTMAVNLAKEIDADLVMASDPDADRVGIACKDDKGEWVLINGNQTCLMYLYYIITQYKKLGKMTGKEFVVKTIVTTELIKKIAEKNGIEMLDCYTGFKWIAREIRLREGKQVYIGGGEESYGFLAEDFVRDKDAVSACCLISEIAAWAKDNGKTLYQLLLDIYVEYGFSKEKGISVVKPGKSGAEEIKQMMVDFRNNPPRELAGSKVILWKDFQTLKQIDEDGRVTKIDMPDKSNVLQYFTQDGGKVSIRPSGTEPKIKFYIEVKGEMGCRNCFAGADASADEKIKAVMKSLGI